ncbi:MAG TPA: DeoR/GlpR family DNA-binding transcription regulator [Erysipelotrichaceae bacterium]|nr:DeoR/GlpR family DNA-binding transcription regulator [Erysipelotrichaceae bacterium]
MKSPVTILDKRRKEILSLLEDNPKLNAIDLSQHFNVSPLTIRRDFQYLEDRNCIQRFYGGVHLVEGFRDKDKRDNDIERRKNLIARKAAEYVENGDTIFINTSTTALLILKYIKDKKVNVITNNANAVFVQKDHNINVLLTGGELREPKESMVGEFAYNNLLKVTANKCFMGCSGISSSAGITTAVLAEVAINELMLRQCTGTSFVLADSTKVGHNHSFVSSELNKIDYLITDNNANKSDCEAIKEKGVKIITINEL